MDTKSAGVGQATEKDNAAGSSSCDASPLKQISEMGYVSLVDDSGPVNRSRSGTEASSPSIETRSRGSSVVGVGYVSLLDAQPAAGGNRTRTTSSSACVDTRDRSASVAGAGYVSLLADPEEPKVSLYIVSANMPTGTGQTPLKVYGGQCHCGAIRFRVHAPQHLVAWDCNCSVCLMKKNTHFVVPQNQFKLLPPTREGDHVHAGAALDHARSGHNGNAPYPLHWGRPPAEADVPAWVRLNQASDSIDAPSEPEEQHEYISTYTFGSKVAKHTFCKICGVQAFYHPRSNPDGVAVTLDCLIPGALKVDTRQEGLVQPDSACTSEVRCFDGQNWEAYVEKSGIRAFSQALQA